LDEVDPKENNFVVLHLIGNHFNFVNRFPQEARVWGKAEEYDNLTEYKNSLHYTDDVVRQFYEYGR
ncbi:MAG: sulfatase-like hydrolase/transferase, partial [Bacteroidaceae bacterium]|nr:sulfatase-like hydrolase/transferase [Bacteroidaceae bacterium]